MYAFASVFDAVVLLIHLRILTLEKPAGPGCKRPLRRFNFLLGDGP